MSSPTLHKGVIFGATGFIGTHLSKHFAKSGHDLILVGSDKERLEMLRKEIELESDVDLVFITIDKNNFNLVEFHNGLKDYLNNISFFINTIGDQNPIGSFVDLNFEDWQRNIEINFLLQAKLLHYFARHFVDLGSGSIVVFSGGGSSNSRPQFSAYASAKTGLVRLVEILGQEMFSHGVKINAIAPGIIPSVMQNEILKNKKVVSTSEYLSASKALKNTNFNPKKIIDLIEFLISNESEGISGKLISAEWDRWWEWPTSIDEIRNSDYYTLRRIIRKDVNESWDSK
jgi:3-oxoacyl-[acyl-carrier protein] reductase